MSPGAPAKRICEAFVHPLQMRQPLENRTDIAIERRTRGRRQHLGTDRGVSHQVPHRAHGLLLRRIVWGGDDDPSRRNLQFLPFVMHLRSYRAIGCVVMPAFIVCEGDGLRSVKRSRNAAAAQDDEPPRLVGAQFSEINGLSYELACVEGVRSATAYVLAMDVARTRVDDEACPVAYG